MSKKTPLSTSTPVEDNLNSNKTVASWVSLQWRRSHAVPYGLPNMPEVQSGLLAKLSCYGLLQIMDGDEYKRLPFHMPTICPMTGNLTASDDYLHTTIYEGTVWKTLTHDSVLV